MRIWVNLLAEIGSEKVTMPSDLTFVSCLLFVNSITRQSTN